MSITLVKVANGKTFTIEVPEAESFSARFKAAEASFNDALAQEPELHCFMSSSSLRRLIVKKDKESVNGWSIEKEVSEKIVSVDIIVHGGEFRGTHSFKAGGTFDLLGQPGTHFIPEKIHDLFIEDYVEIQAAFAEEGTKFLQPITDQDGIEYTFALKTEVTSEDETFGPEVQLATGASFYDVYNARCIEAVDEPSAYVTVKSKPNWPLRIALSGVALIALSYWLF